MARPVATSPLVVRTRLSDERNGPPVAERTAPPVPEELSQPRPDPAGAFEQGQAITPPTPGSQRLVKFVPPCRSRTKMSPTPFVSPGTRFGASLRNATYRPSAAINPRSLPVFPCTPPESTL